MNVFRQDYDYESADHRYEYEADGQRGGVVETRYDTAGSVFSSTYIDWEYDALNRLTKENYDSTDNAADFTATYTFDLVGNRVKKVQTGAQAGTTVSTYNERDQITANGVDADSNGIPDPSTATLYRHDPNGSTTKVSTSASSKLYLWDLRNRMTGYDSNGDDLTFDTVSGSTSVSLGNLNDAGDARFTYDSDGVRLSRTEVGTSSDTVTDYVQDTNNPTGYSQVLEERTNGSLDRSYVIGHSVLGQKDSNGTRQFVPDGHGSTRLLINPSTSTPVQVYDYDAYGNALWTATSQTSILYTNQLFDPIVQQYLLRARYYNQVLGTFSNFDDFEGDGTRPASLHKYLYGDGNPVYRIDPSGNFSLVDVQMNMSTLLRMMAQVLPKVGSDYTTYNRVTSAINAVDALRDVFEEFSEGAESDGFELMGSYAASWAIDRVFDSVVGSALTRLGPAAAKLGERVAESLAKNAAANQITKGTIQATREWFQQNKSKLAGTVHPSTGVRFDKRGFPDFSAFLYKGGTSTVKIELTGVRALDEQCANAIAGLATTPIGYVWHHSPQLGVMQLVDQSIHQAVGHSGGAALWSKLHGLAKYG